jgi:hypothetical protein
MHTDGTWFKDEQGRTLLLRGVNLGGSSKVPFTPDGATHRLEGFFDHRRVSFVGRPFPLDEAEEHYARLKAWGLTFIRFLTTWEAVEHAGPGQYDEDYLDYLYAVVKKAADFGLEVFIDPHQDVWSRFTGGDGAPGWTLEAVGFDIEKLSETGAAVIHAVYGDSYRRNLWPTNYVKLGAATMFTLFFGGDVFAPKTRVEGVPVQEYLQGHFLGAMKQVALRLQDLPHVVGYDTLNEPGRGFIGRRDLLRPAPRLLAGVSPSPFQAMMLGSGHTLELESYDLNYVDPQPVGKATVNPRGVSCWQEGRTCVWKENGVWTDEGGEPRLLRPDHFSQVGGRGVDFVQDFLKPFIKRRISEIRDLQPKAIVFLEADPGARSPVWDKDDAPQVVNASHWYDGLTLRTRHYDPTRGLDRATWQPVQRDEAAIRREFALQLGDHREAGATRLNAPTLIGEVGLTFDLDDKRAYKDKDFSLHQKAMDAYIGALDENLLSFTLWNYTADNTHAWGDQWNDEDLSIFSRDDRDDPSDLHSGGRALEAIVRPYGRRVAGRPRSMKFDPAARVFELVYDHDPEAEGPTEIFVPNYQYPNGCLVEISDGAYEMNRAENLLLVHHTPDKKAHTVRLEPRA